MKGRVFVTMLPFNISAAVEYLVSRGRFRRTMPRVWTPKFRRVRARVNWERPQGGRLLRLDKAAHYVDSDILVYDIDGVNADCCRKAHN